ncbi:MAG: symmetrical bis(5'-nucleosyl)-tetraphosphatase [Magnetococcales bacterium]|nr:symmetrical bis(5'-nucleosyl)-tetraphosphatase [Magnetococcales bacterium]MBF0323293.1 symmetrical bis(5'-nucleosyl)-tetraphosphatase [Magnetococcales bacterium]
MAVYAIGDVHGCIAELESLLRRIRFDWQQDQLWFVGDLINRGPDSLGVLRMVRSMGKRATVVMGNHEFRAILGMCRGGSPYFREHMAYLTQAPEADQILDWLFHLPLFHWDRELGCALVHAGLSPLWSLASSLRRAEEVSSVLTDTPARVEFFHHNENRSFPTFETEAMFAMDRYWLELTVFTRLRRCTTDGRFLWPGTEMGRGDNPFLPPNANSPFQAWYDVRPWEPGDKVVYGHWASAGLTIRPHSFGLDSGCVYGKGLTAIRLDDPKHPIYQVESRAYAPHD